MDSINWMELLEGTDPVDLAFGVGVLAFTLAAIFFFVVIWYFVSAIGFRKMFIKAGEAGWKAFIPFYSDFICFRISWQTRIFVPYLIALLAGYVLTSLSTANAVVSVLTALVCIAYTVLAIILRIRLAKAFGKGVGCGILMIFFPFIVTLVLGYGKAQYVGSSTAPEAQ